MGSIYKLCHVYIRKFKTKYFLCVILKKLHINGDIKSVLSWLPSSPENKPHESDENVETLVFESRVVERQKTKLV